MKTLDRRAFLAAALAPKIALRPIERVREGLRASIAFIGDSTTRGEGASVAPRQMYSKAYPAQVSRLLSARGISSSWQNVFGSGGWNSLLEEDARIGATGGWDFRAPPVVIGGFSFRAASAGTLQFSPEASDLCDIWYVQDHRGGVFSANGRVVQTSGQRSVQKVTVRCPVEVTWVSGSVAIIALRAYSSEPTLECWNWGRSGSRSAMWVDSHDPVFSPSGLIPFFAPDAFVICLGINDWRTRVPVDEYAHNIRMLVLMCRQIGDVFLMSPIPSAERACPLQVQKRYVQALRSIASVNALPLIDPWERWVSNEQSKALYRGELHANARGYAEIAQAVVDALLAR